jgi:hypothetical protein
MSARLSLESKKYISWKGKTFSQITANVRTKIIDYKYTTNNTNVPIMKNSLIMKSQPLKMYRKEIASVSLNTCNHRTSVKISDLMETPGGNIMNSIEPDRLTNGLVNKNDLNLPNLTGDYAGSSCDNAFTTSGTNTNLVNRCLSNQNNALRRVRSSGMVVRKFNEFKNNDTYCTSASQYLDSRNKTFVQNTYHMLRQGDSTCLPGSAASQSNVYASNTAAHCSGSSTNYDPLTTSYVPVYYKPSNSKFAEQGGVSSSTRLLRLKYDTITDAGQKLKTTFGNANANAFAYSTTDSSLYALKTKTGYPNKKTPVINPYSGELKICDNHKFFI